MLSIVVYGRNDSYGYNLHKRVALSLNCFAEILEDSDDEIIFVDYNTPDEFPSLPEALQDTLTPKARRHLRVIRAFPSVHANFAEQTPFNVVEAIARNIGFRRTNPANRWVLSTNTDMILAPRREGRSFNDILKQLDDGFYLLPRFELPETLWELFDRGQPADVIQRVLRWGRDYALNEVINRPLVRYDAPGDFQLCLRQDLFDLSGMDERMLLGNVHVDSNLCRRMEAKRGEMKTLVDDLFGYHTAHTRAVTMVHGRNKISNDFERFVRDVKDWRLFEQDETWGNPPGEIEEVVLPRNEISLVESVLQRTIEPLDKPYDEINWGASSREAMRYSLNHVLSFLTSMIAPLPKNLSIGLVLARPDLAPKILQLWSELGFKGSAAMRRSDLRRLVGMSNFASKPTAVQLSIDGDEDFFEKHDVYLFEFGLASEALNGLAEGKTARIDNEQLSAVQEGFETFVRIERERTLVRAPRRAVFIGAANNRFESIVNDQFDVAHTPFTGRVRQGFLRVEPYAGKGRPGFDPRDVAEALRAAGHRRRTPPADEIVRAWNEIQELTHDKPPTGPLNRLHADLLDVALARGLIKLPPHKVAYVKNQIATSRLSNVHGGKITAGLLKENDPPVASLNKLADPRDWENRAWTETVNRFFGGEEAYSTYNRHRDVWQQAQLVYALRGAGLNATSSVLVVTPQPDNVYAMLSQMAHQVTVTRSVFGHGEHAIDEERWLDVPVLPRPSRIRFVDEGVSELPAGQFEFVVLARNSAQAHGPFGLIRALESAQRVLAPGGRVVVALDVDVGGASAEGLVSASALESLLKDIGARTGLAPADAPDFRLALDAADATVNADRELHRPHFVRERNGGFVSAGMLVLRKRAEPAVEAWAEIKQRRIEWALSTAAARLEAQGAGEQRDESVHVDWDDPADFIARMSRISLPAGAYQLPLSIMPDPHVPDARTIIGVTVEGSGETPLAFADITADEARQGSAIINFRVENQPGEDFSPVDIRLRSYGRAGFSVRPGNLRPQPNRAAPAFAMDLVARNSIGPNAWRRGEEIIVERDAEEGHFFYGPYQRLGAGWWRLLADMEIEEAEDANRPVVELEVLHGTAGLLEPGLQLTPAACERGLIRLDIHVPTLASVEAGYESAFEFRLRYLGGGRVIVRSFILNAVAGPDTEDTWAFCLPQPDHSMPIRLAAGQWKLGATARDSANVSLRSVGGALLGPVRVGPETHQVDLSAEDAGGWLHLESTFTSKGDRAVIMTPASNPFAVTRARTLAVLRPAPAVLAEPEPQPAPTQAPAPPPASAPEPDAAPPPANGQRIFVAHAPLSGARTRSARNAEGRDVVYELAGARSVDSAKRFVKVHKFDQAHVDFSDIDFNMQAIPRVRRIMALNSWVSLVKSLRASSKRIVIEVHQIDAWRHGPAGRDTMRRALFAAADEIRAFSPATLTAINTLFPEYASKITAASAWVSEAELQRESS